jgi:hypothetical protein
MFTKYPLTASFALFAALLVSGPAALGQYVQMEAEEDEELVEEIPEYAGDASAAAVRMTEARDRRDRALDRWIQARDTARSQLIASPEYEEARLRVSQLRDRYRSKRAEVISELEENSKEYRQAKQRARELEQRIQSLRNQPDVSRSRITELSNERLRYLDRADSLMFDKLQTKDIDDLRMKLRQARNKLDKLDAQHREKIMQNHLVTNARERLRSAREDVADARAAYAEGFYEYQSAARQEAQQEDDAEIYYDPTYDDYDDF